MPKISQKTITLSLIAIAWLSALIAYLFIRSKYSGVEHWPSVPATITENTTKTITQRRDSDYDGTKYYETVIGRVTFEYIVNEITYTGARSSANQAHLDTPFNTSSPSAFYNPINPKIAVLINEPYYGGILLKFIIAIPLTTITFLLILHFIFRSI